VVSMASGQLEFDNLDFDLIKDHQGLVDHIQCINKALLIPIVGNIEYLKQEYKDLSYPVHTIALRDAYSHLAKIIGFDVILTADGTIKNKIKRQLERYLGHLEELLYDTYLKIIKKKSDILVERLSTEGRSIDIPKIKMKLAPEVQKIRVVNDTATIVEKRVRYEKIISFIDNYYNTNY